MKIHDVRMRLERLEVEVLPPPSRRAPAFVIVRDNESVAAARAAAGADEHTLTVLIVTTPKSLSTRPAADPDDDTAELEAEVMRLETRRAALEARER